MILTNAEMLESVGVLAKANEKGMLGYAIARNRKKLLDEIKEYSDKRDELLKEFGKDMGNGQFELDPTQATAFFEALGPFSELSFDVPVMQIDPETFYSGNLTSPMMFTLSWMVKHD